MESSSGGAGSGAPRGRLVPRGHPVSWWIFAGSGDVRFAASDSASSGPGLMIGIGLGLSGVVAAPIAGILIQNFGFTVHYIFLAAICLLTLNPISMIRETVDTQTQQEAT